MLVALGAFTWLDRFALDHLMPGLDRRHTGKPDLLGALTPVSDDGSAAAVALDLWLYPASAPLSALAVGAAAVVLWRRGDRRAALLWPAAGAAGGAVELVTKTLLVRPALFAHDRGGAVHIAAFDQSLPSGHALRSALIAATVAYAWPRAAIPVALWAASVAVALVPGGWHTPTDVAAGLALAALLVLGVLEYLQRAGVDRGRDGALRDDREAVAAQVEARTG